jgi:hypothetical protein
VIYFGSQFQCDNGFSPLLAGFVVSEHGEAEHLGREHVTEQSSSPHGGQKAEKERNDGQTTPLKGTSLVTYFLQVDGTSEQTIKLCTLHELTH